MAVQGERLIYDITVNSSGASKELLAFDKSVQQLNKTTQQVSKTFDFFKGILAGYLSFQGAKAFIELADAMQETQSRIAIMTGSMEAAVAVQDELFNIAQKHSIAIKDLSKAYIQLSPVLTEQGKSQKEILQFTDNLVASYKLIGQSSTEAAQSIEQLANAYASGRIDAGQLNSVLFSNRELLKAVAKQMNVTEQELKKMAKSGKESGEDLFKAVIKAGEEWQKAAAKLPVGIGEALTNLANNFSKLATKFAPVVNEIAKGILTISDNFEAAAVGVASFAAALGIVQIAIKGIGAASLLNPVTLAAAALGAVAFLIIKNWKDLEKYFFTLFLVVIPNLIAELEKSFLEFSQTFIGQIINDMLSKWQTFANILIKTYNLIAEHLDWKKIEEVKFVITKDEATERVKEINREIEERNKLLVDYIVSLGIVETKVTDILNKKPPVLPTTTGTGTGDPNDPLGGFLAGIEKAAAGVKTLTDSFKALGEDVFKGLTKSLTDFVKTGKLSMQDLFNTIVDGLIQIGIQKALVAAIGKTTAEGGGGLLGLLFAKGGVFKNNEVTPFAKGGVVSQPTIFPFANGIGLMSEKGAEAIMPLHRDSKGSLGVKSNGNRSSTVVNVYNSAKDSEVETKESTDPNGAKKIEVFITNKIKSVFQSGEMDRTMQTNFGLARSGSR